MNREAGFTLVEVLVVLVAGGLLLMSLSWVLQGAAFEFQRAVKADSRGGEEERLAALARLIEAALPATENERLDQFHYVIEAPSSLAPAGRALLQLRVDQHGEGAKLVARFEPLNDGGANFAAQESTILETTGPISLMSGVAQNSLSTAVAAIPQTAAGAGANFLPASLTIHWAAQGVERQVIMRPRITVDGVCQFDPISLACRN